MYASINNNNMYKSCIIKICSKFVYTSQKLRLLESIENVVTKE